MLRDFLLQEILDRDGVNVYSNQRYVEEAREMPEVRADHPNDVFLFDSSKYDNPTTNPFGVLAMAGKSIDTEYLTMNWDWKEWALAALVRAIKTFFQTFAGFIAVGAAMSDIEWLKALSVSGVAFILSIVTSLAGLPEVKAEKTEPPSDNE